ncbi:MAG: hypothetical protein ACRD4Q_13215 [Candidatus Acidiferrales bacterium]
MNLGKTHPRRLMLGLLCCAMLPWAVAVQAEPAIAAVVSFPVAFKTSAQSSERRNGSADATVGATITFRKIFKSSYPEFVEIVLNQSGSGTYDIRQLADAANPRSFTVGPPLTQKIFDLSGRLHDFQGVDLEVHKRIANLGEKSFRYRKGGEAYEVSFNYTLDPNAVQLVTIFEGLTRQETDLSDLQRTMRYDRLGVNDVVIQIEADYNNKQLPEPEQFLVLLDQVAADAKLIDIARDRARALAGRIRSSH